MYVCDQDNHRMVVYGLDGSFVRQWCTKGSGEGQFNRPWAVAVNWDEVLVGDYCNHRVQVFSLDGSFVRQWGGEGAGAGQFVGSKRISSERGRGVCDEQPSGSSVPMRSHSALPCFIMSPQLQQTPPPLCLPSVSRYTMQTKDLAAKGGNYKSCIKRRVSAYCSGTPLLNCCVLWVFYYSGFLLL